MTKLSYWERRQLKVKAQQLNNTRQLETTMQAELSNTYHDIAKEASMWVDKYAKNQGMNSEQAMRAISGIKTKNWQMTLKQFEAKAKQGGYDSELNAEYYRSRLSRLSALESQMKQMTQGMARKHTDDMRSALAKQYNDTYMRTTYNSQAQKGAFTADFARFNETQLKMIASSPWAKDGKDFSQRIWKNYQKELPSYLMDSLFRATVMGWGPQKVGQMMHAQFQDVQRNKIHNLITSEMGHIAEEATAKSYEESGIDQYEYMATLESHTCDVCAHLDGEHFKMTERKVGVNYPLIHPRCRCTTVPYIEDLPAVGERWMRDPETGKGKQIKDVKFNEWKRLVNGDESIAARSVAAQKSLGTNESLAAVLDSTNMRQVVGDDNYNKFTNHLNQVQDPEVRRLFEEYGSKIEFEPMTSERSGVATRGNKVTLSQSSFTGDEMHVPLGAVYHELAHAMDNLAVQKLKGDSYYGSGVMKTTKMRLGKGWNVMESEIKLHQISSDPKYGLGKSIQRDLWEHTAGSKVPMSDELGKKPRKAAEKKEWIEKSESVYKGKRKLEDWVNSTAKTVKNNPKAWSEVSDMVQGTGLYAMGTDGPFGSGHAQSYFSKSRNLGTFENQASEFFAQLTEAKAVNPGALKNITNIFPKSSKKYKQIIEDMTGRAGKRNFNPSKYELMSKSKAFDVGNSQIRVHPVKNQNYNIWVQKNSQQSRGTVQLLNKNLPNLGGYKFPEIVVVDKKVLQTKGGNLGVAGYDHSSDTLFISNTLSSVEDVTKALEGDYFAANSFEDVLVHELSHKKHWDAAKSIYNRNPKKYNSVEEVKRMIDEPIRAYISQQNRTTPGYLFEISDDAYFGFTRGRSINEVVAEVMVANKNLSDEKLFSLVKELLKDGNHG